MVGWLVSVSAFSLASLAACGSRGPLDDQPYGDASTDVGQVDAVASDATADAAPPVVDAKADVSPIINCAQCLASQCGQKIATCIQDTQCRTILQCAAQKCIQGGLDPKCLGDCAQGNIGGLAGAFSAFQCVTSKCGDACLSLLGGLGGN
ncbi:hypothetical protein BH09MYX1_BH09MYX1_56600 [soil metagenome]